MILYVCLNSLLRLANQGRVTLLDFEEHFKKRNLGQAEGHETILHLDHFFLMRECQPFGKLHKAQVNTGLCLLHVVTDQRIQCDLSVSVCWSA